MKKNWGNSNNRNFIAISEQEYITNLGIKIRQLRASKNISQQVLADMCNMPKSTIGRIERGEVAVTIRTLIRISNAIEIDLVHFLVKK